ncbi:ATP-binding protein [Ramlibacter rhizophilus]|nr:ATP-binding protein [Ramlibacter rhizophilus]
MDEVPQPSPQSAPLDHDALRTRLEGLGSSLHLLQEIVFHAPVSLQLFDTSGRCVLFNPKHTELFGAMPPEDYNVFEDTVLEGAGVLERLRQAFAGKRSVIPPLWYDARELGNVHLDTGRRFALSAELVPLRMTGGDVTHVMAVATDVTEAVLAREKAEAAARGAAFLSEAGRLLNSSLDLGQTLSQLARLATPTLADYCIVDLVEADGSVRRVAAAHADRLGQPILDEMANFPPVPGSPQPARRVLDSGEPELLPELDADLLAERSLDPVHHQLLRRLGVRSHLAVPMRSGHRIVGAISLGYVLARRYRPEDIPLAEALASRAAVAIDNARLYGALARSEAALRELDRRKDEFIAVLAHELRNPLSAISNVGWALRSQALRPEMERSVNILARQTGRLTGLVNDLMDVSRITRGLVVLRPREVDLRELIDRALESVQVLVQDQGHAVTVECPDTAVPVRGDPARLEQIVVNLLGNAVKYTDPGGRIRVSLRTTQDRAVLQVHDPGIGIAPEFLPRIFDMFAQAEPGLSRSRGGLGIGLTIARRLVELHGGRIEASSVGVGQGATFTVELPLASPGAGEAGAGPAA